MENASLLSSDVWDDVTTTPSDDLPLNLMSIRHLALKIVYVIIGIVGVIDNSFVLVIFILFIKISDKTINLLIVNQSVVDMCASLFTLLVAVVEVDGTHMSSDSAYDQFVCRMWLTRMPLWCLLTMSSWGIVFVALERYIAVMHPIWYKQEIKKRGAYVAVFTIWVLIPVFDILVSYLFSNVVDGVCIPMGYYSSVAQEKTAASLIFLVTYLLPLAVMTFCYSRIVYALRTKVNVAASSSLNAAGRDAVVTSLFICCGFVLCWSINEMTFFLNIIGAVRVDFSGWFYNFTIVLVLLNSCINPAIYAFSGWFYNFTIVLVLLNSCINPAIYAAKYRDFQDAVKRLLQKN